MGTKMFELVKQKPLYNITNEMDVYTVSKFVKTVGSIKFQYIKLTPFARLCHLVPGDTTGMS